MLVKDATQCNFLHDNTASLRNARVVAEKWLQVSHAVSMPSAGMQIFTSLHLLITQSEDFSGFPSVPQICNPSKRKRVSNTLHSSSILLFRVCVCMRQATAPQNVRGSVLNYSSEQLLVHLDDQDESMQRAVFSVLEVRLSFSDRLCLVAVGVALCLVLVCVDACVRASVYLRVLRASVCLRACV